VFYQYESAASVVDAASYLGVPFPEDQSLLKAFGPPHLTLPTAVSAVIRCSANVQLQIGCESYCKSPEVDLRQLLRRVGQIHACSNPKEQAANLVRHKSHRFAEPALPYSYASVH
jgi:hypothetical protein